MSFGDVNNPWVIHDSYGDIHFLSPEKCMELGIDLDVLEHSHAFLKDGTPCMLAKVGTVKMVLILEGLE